MKALIVQHVICEGPGLLGDALLKRGWELDIRHMDLPNGTLPSNLVGYNAFVVLGGPMGAYEETTYPYLSRVQELIREAAATGLPTVGVCLGGQLIARALGAEVKPNPVKEIGWYLIRLTSEGRIDPLFAGLQPEFHVFQWHGDAFALPAGASLLAQGDLCPNQAFVYNSVWALQFHLEVTPDIIDDWAVIYADELAAFGGPGATESLAIESRYHWDAGYDQRERFLNNLCTILESKADKFTPQSK